MATTPITINIDSTIITEAVNALCTQGGYQATISDGSGGQIANPQTKNQFAKQMVIGYIKNAVIEQRNRDAQAAVTAIDTNLIS